MYSNLYFKFKCVFFSLGDFLRADFFSEAHVPTCKEVQWFLYQTPDLFLGESAVLVHDDKTSKETITDFSFAA